MSGSLLVNGKQRFVDNNGAALVGGKVYFYIPSTTTPKNTYQDRAQTILNTNPVILDSRGEAVIWGAGAYRQILKDSLDNTIWDQETYGVDPDLYLQKAQNLADLTSASAARGNLGLDGLVVPVGAMVCWPGAVIPSNYLVCDGAAVSRTTYASLFSVVGTTFGAGDGSTTFNLPDARGRALFGKDNMGGSAANRITNAISGITGTTLGASGGDERLFQHTHTVNVTDPGHSHTITRWEGYAAGTAVLSSRDATSFNAGNLAGAIQNASTGITATAVNAGAGTAQNMPPALIVNIIIRAT